MKKLTAFCFMFMILLSFSACSAGNSDAGSTGTNANTEVNTNTEVNAASETNAATEAENKNILVVNFSATGTTKALAEHAAEILGADLYQIEAAVSYTSDDLNYNDTASRTTREQNDPAARPAISGAVQNMEQYDTVFIGYPIWNGQAPRIISTFLESYDFSGKTIVPFCTSHSSPVGSSDTNLHALTGTAVWKPGKRFEQGASYEAMEDWLNQ